MDPIAIGMRVGSLFLPQVTRKLMEQASNPEIVAKSVNWVFSAVSNFFKIRHKEKAANSTISSPPEPQIKEEVSSEIGDLDVEEKTEAVQEIARSLENPSEDQQKGEIQLLELDDFTINQLSGQIESQLRRIETFLRNLNFEEEKAAQHGGIEFAPVIIMNTIRIQQEGIVKNLRQLNRAMDKLYGISAPELDNLARITLHS